MRVQHIIILKINQYTFIFLNISPIFELQQIIALIEKAQFSAKKYNKSGNRL